MSTNKKKRRWSATEEKRERPIDLPAGHSRDEAMRKAADTLAQEAEALADDIGIGAIDPSKLEEDREIVNMLTDSSHVRGAVEGFVYCWVRFKSASGQNGVDEKLAWTIGGDPVWEVVKGDMPEAKERKNESGYRVMADVLLMRARKDRYDKLQQYLEFQHERRVDSSIKTLRDFADKQHLTLHEFGDGTEGSNDQQRERAQRAREHAFNYAPQNYADDLATGRAILKATARDVKAGRTDSDTFFRRRHGLKQMAAQQIAARYIDKAIREGRMPGLAD